MGMKRYICIHGHFYQPPRENPWLEEIEFQDGAYPYHDWNEKITAECYAPNAASRILDSEERIIDIINTYSKISFDFGPTLLSWMERHKPDVHQAIIDADRLSMEKFSGHGSAVAQAYNHMIMPLANRRDKYTQVIWGIRDFQKRFGRMPEGMWLPEAAVDIETLEVLVSQGITFTILSPRQAKRIRKKGDGQTWKDVSDERIDPTMAYECTLPSGRSINLFFYDGPASQEISFGELLKNGVGFAKRLLSLFNEERNWPELVHLATDGETFGHHHLYGDMALSFALHHIESNDLATITNYSEYLSLNPPTHSVEIFENSSWSCIHGIERWRNNCGCHSGQHQGWTQTWRKPLRDGLDWLRDQLIPIYGNRASDFFSNPWDARNDYIDVLLDRSKENIDSFFTRHAVRKLDTEEQRTALKLLEIQRNAMLMYTSCGWFFDEISGIETVQIMQYASKAIQYVEELQGETLEAGFMKYLYEAQSNIFESGVTPYEMFVKPAKSDLLRVGAHYSISSIFKDYPESTAIYCYTAESEVYNRKESGKLRLVTGKSRIRSNITWAEKTISFAVLHLGDTNINAGVRESTNSDKFSAMEKELSEAFNKGDIPEVIRVMDKHFNGTIFSLWHLFRDEHRKVLDQILQLTYEGVESSYRQIYENNSAIMNFYLNLQQRLPRPFFAATEYILNTDLKKIFEEEIDIERLGRLIEEWKKWSVNLDKTTIGFTASSWITSVMRSLKEQPDDTALFEKLDNTLEALSPLDLPLNLWEAQNIYFSIGKGVYKTMAEKGKRGDEAANVWVKDFLKLGRYLHVKI
ncbi:MAG: DUF3536 domain-containing protein [Nitrospiraceae bacterium]|nr:MAG: DUF3536 domain-containing protein [Nitrospiraceae bacterium]